MADRRQRLRDGTPELAQELEREHSWVRLLSVPGAAAAERGAPIVRSLHAAIDELAANPPDFVVNVDADISFDPDYFPRLLDRFDADPALGIASGSAFELQDGDWRQRHVTGSTVWGASRAFRWACLQEILPFEERVGWDGIDEFKANARGWHTQAFEDLPFKHHRREGERDGRLARAAKPGSRRVLRRLSRLVSRPARALERAPGSCLRSR